MLILPALLLLFITPLAMALLSLVLRSRSRNQPVSLEQPLAEQAPISFAGRVIGMRPSSAAYLWLLALAGGLITWILTLISQPAKPITFLLVHWRPTTYFPESPQLLLDPISWSFALALATLTFAVILTVPIRMQGNQWLVWASCLSLGGLGLTSVLAGNILTLLLAWVAIDMVEILILLTQVRDSQVHTQALVSFTARVGGLGLLLWVDMTSRTAGNLWVLPPEGLVGSISPSVSLALLIAAGLRLGVLPLRLPLLNEPPLRRGLGTLLRLVPAASSLVLLSRISYFGVPTAWKPFLLVLVGLSALVASYLWISAPDELNGRPYWILATTAFAVASAICAIPQASLAWSLACMLSGGLIFLFSSRRSYLMVLPLFGFLGFSGLPFTPAWGGMQLYTSRSVFYIFPLLLFAQVLLMAGYVRHAFRTISTPSQPQRWVGLIYPLGMILLPGIQFAWLWQAARWTGAERISIGFTPAVHLPLFTWIGGGVVSGLAVLFLWIGDRWKPRIPRYWISIGQKVFSMQWLYRVMAVVLIFSVRWVRTLTELLEGDGGILWVLVLLALLVVMLLRGGRL